MAEVWRDTDYAHRKQITVQHAYVDSDLTDFPLYVYINADTDINTSRVQADLDDIRFYDGSGNLLKHEVESYSIDGTSCTANIWVKKPSVYTSPSGTDNQLWLYYGYASATNGEDVANVWDSNYKGVWHLDDASTNIADSTASLAGTKTGNATAATGKVGTGCTLDGTGDYYTLGSPAALEITGTAARTVSMWAKTDANTAYLVGFSVDNSSNKCLYRLQLNAAGNKAAFTMANSVGTEIVLSGSTTTISTGTWYQFTGVYDGTNSHIYVNGAEDASAGTITPLTTTISEGNIGTYRAHSAAWQGDLDEVRVSNTARSAAWIKFEYHNVTEADNELTWGAEETYYAPFAIDSSTGVLTIADGSGLEAGQEWEIVVRVTDDASATDDATITVTLEAAGGTDYSESVDDSLGLTDSAASAAGYVRTAADDLGITDIAAKFAAYARTVADAEGLTDSPSQLFAIMRTIDDSEGMTDSASRAWVAARTVDDAMGLADAVATLRDVFITVADSLGLSDSASSAAEFIRAIADTEGLTDLAARAVEYVRTIDDTEGLTDAVAAGKVFAILIADAMGLLDSAGVSTGYEREVADALGLTDSQTSLSAFIRTISDSEGIADAVARITGLTRTIADSIGLSDENIQNHVRPTGGPMRRGESGRVALLHRQGEAGGGQLRRGQASADTPLHRQ